MIDASLTDSQGRTVHRRVPWWAWLLEKLVNGFMDAAWVPAIPIPSAYPDGAGFCGERMRLCCLCCILLSRCRLLIRLSGWAHSKGAEVGRTGPGRLITP